VETRTRSVIRDGETRIPKVRVRCVGPKGEEVYDQIHSLNDFEQVCVHYDFTLNGGAISAILGGQKKREMKRTISVFFERFE
jgi:hypothetical protein